MQKSLFVLFAALVPGLLGGQIARADDILLGGTHQAPPAPGSFIGSGGNSLAQSFYLERPITLSSINFGVFSDAGQNDQIYLFQLTDRIGPGTTANDVLISFTTSGGFIPGTPVDPGHMPPYLTFAVPFLKLQPGEYFLTDTWVNPTTLEGGSAWGQSAPLVSSVGEEALSFVAFPADLTDPAMSSWSQFQIAEPLDFQLIGQTREVPEPTTWILLVAGFFIALVLIPRQNDLWSRQPKLTLK